MTSFSLTFRVLLFAAFLVSSTIVSSTYAGIILAPPGVNPGDKFRIVMVVRPTITATSANIADYDSHVSNAAASAGLTYNGLSVSWQAIVSTPTVNANDPTRLPTASTAAIFRVDGTKVANNASDLWDGAVLVPIQLDENGLLLTSRQVFTGTNVNGFGIVGQTLGHPSGTIARGDTDFSDSFWVNRGIQTSTSLQRVYGISQELTVAVPELSSVGLCGLLILGQTFVRIRRFDQRERNIY